ncbi:MAG: hypothetical protein ACI9RO_002562 [Alteromonas macleodii]|jgi:hypothetical protein
MTNTNISSEIAGIFRTKAAYVAVNNIKFGMITAQ